MRYDVVIIGAGVAGLYAAINIARTKRVLLINKSDPWQCNTYYAQGGITTAVDEDDIPAHIEDTLNAGAGLCNKEAVEVLSRCSRDVIDDLIARGFEFDKDSEGHLLYTKEAGHSRSRILHAGGDATGRCLHHFLLEQNPHPMLANATVVDLMIQDKQCCGVVALHNNVLKQIFAKHVIIASGGVGSLFAYHTNARRISGDIHGVCIERGIALENMEFMQFHPTVYVSDTAAQKQLLSEALRGEGALVVDENGYRFLFDYDKRGELATRDIVSRAIFDYSQKTGKKVFLSFENFELEYFRKRFPNISKNLLELGFSLPRQKVPISPAFHYAIGGIKTDLDGDVHGLNGLYAIGEVASTGVHGANRLASNSLLEGLVFAKRAARKIVTTEDAKCPASFPYLKEKLIMDGDKERKGKLRCTMWDNVSIVRTQAGLKRAKEEIETMLDEPIGRLLKLRLLTARSIVISALGRSESVGAHYIKKENE